MTGNVVEGEEKGLTVDQFILSHVKETEKKLEETGKNETHTLLASQKVDLNLSFVPNSMEGLKEGEPTSQESSLSPVCCPSPPFNSEQNFREVVCIDNGRFG